MSDANEKLNAAETIGPNELELLDEEIKAAEAEAAQIESATLEATAVERKRALLEQTKRKVADARLIEKFTLSHGIKGKNWDTLNTGAGLVVIAKPAGPLARFYTRWVDEGQSTKESELMKLIKPCLLHPVANEFEKWCTAEPATPTRSANVICSLAGARTKDLEGK